MHSILVTGAAKGIGHACVTRLALAGHRVFAGVRTPADGEALRTELGPGVEPVVLDVTNADQVADAARFITDRAGGQLHGLVNNAGIAVAGPLEFLPVSELRRQLEVNVIGQIAVTQAMLPMIRPVHGRIVFIGSISGRSALPMTGPYSASKFALEALTDSLRVELMDWGIDVVIVEPGVIATPIWETSIAAAERLQATMPAKAMEYYGRIINAVKQRATGGTMRGLPPDHVAKVVEHALFDAKPRTRYVVGKDARLRLLVQKLPDRWRDKVIARQLRKL